MKIVNRTSRVPAYIFSRIDTIRRELEAQGVNIINLGIGDPDLPTPHFITDTMKAAIMDSGYHKYPPYSGTDKFKREVALYYKRRFGVELDPDKEIAALIGSKEGIAHLFLALTDPEDYVLIPDPGYPAYLASAKIAGNSIYRMNLSEANGFLPELDNIFPEVARKAKLVIVNYPNNPTGAEANSEFFKKLVEFGVKNDVVVVNDGAYLDIADRGSRPVSIMQTEGAKDIAVEFGSLSKPYNMTGWRLGYIVGNSKVIEKLMIIKTNFDSGQFGAIQDAGTAALRLGDNFIKEMNSIYEVRRQIAVNALEKAGLKVYRSGASFYVWFQVPKSFKSEEFASFVLKEAGVIITPGNAYGAQGEGYCRISLTVEDEILRTALDKICGLRF